jgi:lysophospholipase L1-like esterase
MHTPFARLTAKMNLSCLAALALLATAAPGVNAQVTPSPPQPPAPVISEEPRDASLPTIWVAGDSTAARDTGEKKQGWAVPFADYFDPSKINVVNRARGGRSSRTFITEGLWDRLMAGVKPGDIVLIQFGHNDAGALNDEPPPPLRARGTIPGLGSETKEIDNVLTKKHEVVHTFGWYMRGMVADAKAKGATPIILSPTVRDIWKEGHVERDSGHYTSWSAEIAKEAQIPFIDVNRMVADRFERLGQVTVHSFYPQDHTHFNTPGADTFAAAAVAALKANHTALVERALSPKGTAVSSDPAAWAQQRP